MADAVTIAADIVGSTSVAATTETVVVVGDVAVGGMGPRGPKGDTGGMVSMVTAQNLSGHRAVTVDDDGLAIYADATDPDHLLRPVWLTIGAWDAAATATLVQDDIVSEPSWSWNPGLVYLGADGHLTQTPSADAAFMRVLGEVVTATKIAFHPYPPIATIQ